MAHTRNQRPPKSGKTRTDFFQRVIFLAETVTRHPRKMRTQEIQEAEEVITIIRARQQAGSLEAFLVGAKNLTRERTV